jgi:hypothetical protein
MHHGSKGLNRLFKRLTLAAALFGSAHAFADTVTRSFCIFDPVGANGIAIQQLQDYVVQALNWGIKFDMKPYTDEDVAISDFKTGKCDAVALTGVHNIQFVKFAGSLDMVGGLQTYDQEHEAIEAILSPKAAKYMVQGEYEVAGVVPGGKVFLFARNKDNLSSLQKAAGKRVAVLSVDKQASTLANVAGAAPVPATIATFGPMFNNGSVEYAYAPSAAYKALELYKGLGTDGGIADYVLGMLSLQLDIHRDRFPPDFGQQSRSWVADNSWDRAMSIIGKLDSEIPDNYWVHIDADRTKSYSEMLIKVRQGLWDSDWYDHTMQHMLKKIRCKSNPSAGECSEPSEGGPI